LVAPGDGDEDIGAFKRNELHGAEDVRNSKPKKTYVLTLLAQKLGQFDGRCI
jgi:hypothetical protein